MPRIVYIISAVAVALVLNNPAWAGESEEEQQIIKTVKETWTRKVTQSPRMRRLAVGTILGRLAAWSKG